MTVEKAKRLTGWCKQQFYYYKKKGAIHIVDGEINDDEIWNLLDSKVKPLTEKRRLKVLESMITLSCELKGQFTLAELGYALLNSDLLNYQQQNDLLEALEL